MSYLLGVGEPQPRDLEPEQLRRQIGVAARTLVGQRPQQGPLLIVVQDLHWAVPQPALTPEILQAVASRHVELARELQIPAADQAEIKRALCRRDGFEPVAAEQVERRDWSDRYGGQLTGRFLVDREGIVRWVNIEGAKDGLAGLERFPSDEEFLAAARPLVG